MNYGNFKIRYVFSYLGLADLPIPAAYKVPIRGHLDSGNRWVSLARQVPWELAEEIKLHPFCKMDFGYESVVLVVIVKKELKIERSLSKILQILSVNSFKKTPVLQLLDDSDYRFCDTPFPNQLLPYGL